MKKLVILCVLFCAAYGLNAQLYLGPKAGIALSRWSIPSTKSQRFAANYDSRFQPGIMAGAVAEYSFGGRYAICVEGHWIQRRGELLPKIGATYARYRFENGEYQLIRNNMDIGSVNTQNKQVTGKFTQPDPNGGPAREITTDKVYNQDDYYLNYVDFPVMFKVKSRGRNSGGYLTTGLVISSGIGGKYKRGFYFQEGTKRPENIEEVATAFSPDGNPEAWEQAGAVDGRFSFGTGSNVLFYQTDIGMALGLGSYINLVSGGQILIDVRYVSGMISVRKNFGPSNPFYNRSLQLTVSYLFDLGGVY